MNYDAEAYAHKTSGLLWLAAWYRLPVAVPPGTWLEREARRLGVPLIPQGKALTPANAVVQARAFGKRSFQTVFTPFHDWLETLEPPQNREEAVTVTPPAPRASRTPPPTVKPH